MAIAYLSLGANIGNKRQQLIKAAALLAERVGDVLVLSQLYETEPWGFKSVNTFLNGALKLETTFSAEDLRKETEAIEIEIGRKSKTSKEGYQDRLIDIDILLYDDCIMETSDLVIPHPHMHKRNFVLKPMTEIAPFVKHPLLKRSMVDLFTQIKNKTENGK